MRIIITYSTPDNKLHTITLAGSSGTVADVERILKERTGVVTDISFEIDSPIES